VCGVCDVSEGACVCVCGCVNDVLKDRCTYVSRERERERER